MPLSPELEAKLKSCDPEVQQFVTQLQSENAKAQSRIAKLEAQKVSHENRITSLQKELSVNIEAFSHNGKDKNEPTIDDVRAYLDGLPK